MAAIFATMVAWWNLGLPRLVFSPEQMSDTQPLDLNSAPLGIGRYLSGTSTPLGIGRHVSGIADPFNGHIDEFRISHVQRSDGWIETTYNNMSNPVRSQWPGPKSRKAASRHRSQALASSSAS